MCWAQIRTLRPVHRPCGGATQAILRSVTIVLAIIGVMFTGATLWVGWQNMQMAKVKLYHDLYDRRSRMFDAARHLIFAVEADGTILQDVMKKYSADTAGAAFLFNDEMDRYL